MTIDRDGLLLFAWVLFMVVLAFAALRYKGFIGR